MAGSINKKNTDAITQIDNFILAGQGATIKITAENEDTVRVNLGFISGFANGV